MTDQHRATAEQWAWTKDQADDSLGHAAYSTIQELLHRVEALEATQHAHVDLSHLSDAEQEKILNLLANPSRFEVLEVAQPVKPDHNEAVTTIPINCRALCIELLDKYDLEWRARERLKEVLAQPNYPEKLDSSLVEDVAAIIDNGTACGRDSDRIARAAIRAVAVWVRKHKQFGAAVWSQRLKEEAER
jgi:hypothetical protein